MTRARKSQKERERKRRERGRKRLERWISSRSTGKKEAEDVIDVKAVEQCEQGVCPCCGGNLEVIGVMKIEDFVIEHDYGGGYCAVRDPPYAEREAWARWIERFVRSIGSLLCTVLPGTLHGLRF